MIPSVIASQVQQGVKDFLRTTFPIATPHFHHLLDSLIGKENGLFLGQYLSIHLPFRQGLLPRRSPAVPALPAPGACLPKAFRGAPAVDAGGHGGTGSVKTECFLYPILDSCHRHRGEPGIMAILVYPSHLLQVCGRCLLGEARRSRRMRLFLSLPAPFAFRLVDVADHGLSARVDMNMFEDDFLWATFSIP